MRLDLFLFNNNLVSSRTEAKNIIQKGCVQVNGKVIKKSAYETTDDSDVKVVGYEKKYVSRGGYKLECAIKNFNFSITGKKGIDIGASSGGFTDCLLQNGASNVIALDSGVNQLVDKIRKDERVFVIENYNARYLNKEDIPYVPEIAVMDVSFISATYIIPAVFDILASGGDFICLIKPQFEVGKSNLGKGGIVKDDDVRKSALTKVIAFAEQIGFKTMNTVVSDVVGGDGNVEFLAHFIK